MMLLSEQWYTHKVGEEVPIQHVPATHRGHNNVGKCLEHHHPNNVGGRGEFVGFN